MEESFVDLNEMFMDNHIKQTVFDYILDKNLRQDLIEQFKYKMSLDSVRHQKEFK